MTTARKRGVVTDLSITCYISLTKDKNEFYRSSFELHVKFVVAHRYAKLHRSDKRFDADLARPST